MSVLENSKISPAQKQNQTIFFIDMLIACMKAEESCLFDALQGDDICQDLAFDVIEGNAIAQILISDLKDLHYENKWDDQIVSKLKTLIHIIQNNSNEKEALLAKADFVLSKKELFSLGKKFQKSLM